MGTYSRALGLLILTAMLGFSACSGGGEGGGPGALLLLGGGGAVVDIAAISGVTPPAYSETPVTEITETDQYTGTVSWSDSPVTFAATTIYTATITLTAKPGYTLNGVTENFFTVADADTVSNNTDSGVVTAIFPKTDWQPYDLRDTGPAGGLIFYINPNAATDGWKYLEAAPVSTEWGNKVWGGYGTTVTDADGTAIGTGKQNTIDIVDQLGDAEPYQSKTNYAAKLCSDLEFGGYDDWFLPSHDELNLMYTNLYLNGVGGFSSGSYWSSSEEGINNSWAMIFSAGAYDNNVKFSDLGVRAVRAF